jgi:hypothetical protein
MSNPAHPLIRPTATLASYGLSSGLVNAYPQSIDNLGQEVWTNADISSGEKSASFCGDISDSKSMKGGFSAAGKDD